MIPGWLAVLSICWIVVALVSSAAVIVDIRGRGYRQHMRVMEWVWPITCLYLGPIGLWFYWRVGRRSTMKWHEANGAPNFRGITGLLVASTHCGAGCTLGDIIAETLIFVFRITIFGAAIWASFVLDYAFALVLGVIFQYAAIQQMKKGPFWPTVKRAAKADVLSLTAFEIGLFAWMALTFWVFFPAPHLDASNIEFWFMMQVGMALGLLTSIPMNAFLVSRGIKETM